MVECFSLSISLGFFLYFSNVREVEKKALFPHETPLECENWPLCGWNGYNQNKSSWELFFSLSKLRRRSVEISWLDLKPQIWSELWIKFDLSKFCMLIEIRLKYRCWEWMKSSPSIWHFMITWDRCVCHHWWDSIVWFISDAFVSPERIKFIFQSGTL